MALFFKRPKPLVLVVMDGVGVASPGPGNVVTTANTPNLDKLWNNYPHTYLEASGLNVGVPQGTDGNSEVGHMALGAGKVIFQSLPRIDNSISSGEFFSNVQLREAFDRAKRHNTQVHIMGLVGEGSVHASLNHLIALIKFAAQEKINGEKVFIHIFTDGRDSAPDSSISSIEKVEQVCLEKKTGRIASIVGRAYAMDRNRNWERTKIAYDLLVNGKGKVSTDWRSAIRESYSKNIMDEYIDPIAIPKNDRTLVTVNENDSIIFFNFRPDRAVQLTMAFDDPEFSGFARERIDNLYFVGMTDYENGFPKNKAFPPEKVSNPVGKILSDNRLKQLRIAESEKFPHVTYFFNGANKEIYPFETWVEIPSPEDVSTYDQKPEMSQKWVTEVLIKKIQSDEFDFILVNFAGPDMVAHTGNIQATIKAMETCDECVGKIVETVFEKDGVVMITADHGNAEELIDQNSGNPDTKHSTNQVPFITVKKGLKGRELTVGGLTDVAPTILGLLGISTPPEMTGRDLLS
jgi:2,3-bisphosphoglycerate-independent phosphoglycerate mutase